MRLHTLMGQLLHMSPPDTGVDAPNDINYRGLKSKDLGTLIIGRIANDRTTVTCNVLQRGNGFQAHAGGMIANSPQNIAWFDIRRESL